MSSLIQKQTKKKVLLVTSCESYTCTLHVTTLLIFLLLPLRPLGIIPGLTDCSFRSCAPLIIFHPPCVHAVSFVWWKTLHTAHKSGQVRTGQVPYLEKWQRWSQRKDWASVSFVWEEPALHMVVTHCMEVGNNKTRSFPTYPCRRAYTEGHKDPDTGTDRKLYL